MHVQTRGWRTLSKEQRDAKLLSLGISSSTLSNLRAQEPKTRLVAAAALAVSLDPDPNSDLIDFIAGYSGSSGLFHYFKSKKELFEEVPPVPKIQVRRIETSSDEIDLADFIPAEFRGYPVYFEPVPDLRLHVWQKVPGGIRKVTLNRRLPKLLFLSGVLLYATEGSKLSSRTSYVELSNATPGIQRLFLEFLRTLGISRTNVKARIQLHDIVDEPEARRYWNAELGLRDAQYQKPLMALKRGNPRRRTFTLNLKYNNAMLNVLLTAWAADPDQLCARLNA